MAGRPFGAKNRKRPGDEGYKQPGRKAGATALPRLPDEQIIELKHEILKLMSSGEATTLSEAARMLEIDPSRVYAWGSNDKDFQEAVRQTREVVADDIEAKLRVSKNFIPLMFLLKAYRPMFRDTFKFEGAGSQRLEELLEKLAQLKQETVEDTPDRESLDSNPTGENTKKEE